MPEFVSTKGLTLEEVEQKLAEIQAGAAKREPAYLGAVMNAKFSQKKDIALDAIIKDTIQK